MANVLVRWELRKYLVSHWYSLLLTIFIIAIVETGIYLAFFQPPWLSYKNTPFPVLNEDRQVRLYRGEPLRLLIDRCSTESSKRLYTVALQLVREDAAQLPQIIPASPSPVEPGCSSPKERPVTTIPPSTKCGRYHLTGYAEVHGPLRTHTIEFNSQSFDVVCPE